VKKSFLIIVLLLSISLLVGCAGTALDIDAYEWELKSAVKTNVDLDAATELSFGKVVLDAKNGKMTIKDADGGNVYSGSYIETGSSSTGRDYSFTIGKYTGYGILSNTDYYGDEHAPTISISLAYENTRYNLILVAKK
jgi:hypothetical protein